MGSPEGEPRLLVLALGKWARSHTSFISGTNNYRRAGEFVDACIPRVPAASLVSERP